MACRIPLQTMKHPPDVFRCIQHILKAVPSAASSLNQHLIVSKRYQSRRTRGTLSSVIQPLPVQPATKNADDINIGEELTGVIKKGNRKSGLSLRVISI